MQPALVYFKNCCGRSPLGAVQAKEQNEQNHEIKGNQRHATYHSVPERVVFKHKDASSFLPMHRYTLCSSVACFDILGLCVYFGTQWATSLITKLVRILHRLFHRQQCHSHAHSQYTSRENGQKHWQDQSKAQQEPNSKFA
eukprot:594296-Amphidinium_carterae.1